MYKAIGRAFSFISMLLIHFIHKYNLPRPNIYVRDGMNMQIVQTLFLVYVTPLYYNVYFNNCILQHSNYYVDYIIGCTLYNSLKAFRNKPKKYLKFIN